MKDEDTVFPASPSMNIEHVSIHWQSWPQSQQINFQDYTPRLPTPPLNPRTFSKPALASKGSCPRGLDYIADCSWNLETSLLVYSLEVLANFLEKEKVPATSGRPEKKEPSWKEDAYSWSSYFVAPQDPKGALHHLLFIPSAMQLWM